MKKLIYVLIAVAVLFSSCNPDSNSSIIFDKLHANPSSDYRINRYVGDYENKLVLGTSLGIMLYDIENFTYEIIVDPISDPIMVINDYVIYYQQGRDENAILKAYNLKTKATYNADITIITTDNNRFTDVDLATDNLYRVMQNGSINYTVQEREETEEGKEPVNRTIVFYHFISTNCSISAPENENKVTITITNAETKSVSSSSKVAPYVVGDGYYAFLNEDKNYYDVYSINDSNTSDARSVWHNNNNEIIAFYGEHDGHKIAVDNLGYVYVDSVSKGDYGSVPLDNRRVIYSTFSNDGRLLLCFKYGPEILFVNSDGNISRGNTKDINDETVVGIKYYNDSYYVVTEESEVIRTGL